jgi:NAD-dependent aldehyde dehydrogenases
MTDQEIMDSMMQKAKKAQKEFEKYNQEQVDEVVRTIAKTVFDNAEKLARMAVDETGMGVYEDKVKKNMGKARVIWEDCKGGKSVGIIERIPEEGLVVVAKPMGVIGCITPTTNPIVTPMCNAMFAAKGRNAVIICPHPRSKKCSTETVVLINEALAKIGAPENLIQCIAEPTMELSGLVMKECDVCISTGGAGMVKAAYASGKPAFGVGPGNVQTIIDDDVDLEKVIPMIIEGRCFDNGIICSGEQTAIMMLSGPERIPF